MHDAIKEVDTRTIRRFRLIDAMIFVAACAPGFYHVAKCLDDPYLTARSKTFGAIMLKICHYVNLIIPLMFMMTVSAFVVRLRKPRGSLRSVLRQPGAIACFGAIAACALGLIGGVASHAISVLDSGNDTVLA